MIETCQVDIIAVIIMIVKDMRGTPEEEIMTETIDLAARDQRPRLLQGNTDEMTHAQEAHLPEDTGSTADQVLNTVNRIGVQEYHLLRISYDHSTIILC